VQVTPPCGDLACVRKAVLDRHRRAFLFIMINVGAHIMGLPSETAQGGTGLRSWPSTLFRYQTSQNAAIPGPMRSRGLTCRCPFVSPRQCCHGIRQGQYRQWWSIIPAHADFSALSDQIPETSRQNQRSRRRILAILGGGNPRMRIARRTGMGGPACQRRLVPHAIGDSLWVQTDGAPLAKGDRQAIGVHKVRQRAVTHLPDEQPGATGWGKGIRRIPRRRNCDPPVLNTQTRIRHSGKGSVAAPFSRTESCGIEYRGCVETRRRPGTARQNHLRGFDTCLFGDQIPANTPRKQCRVQRNGRNFSMICTPSRAAIHPASAGTATQGSARIVRRPVGSTRLDLRCGEGGKEPRHLGSVTSC